MSVQRRWTVAGFFAAVAAYFVMAVSSVAHKSGTFDEFAHITAGYTYWSYNDYRLQPDNGNWPQRLVSLPVILGGAPFPTLDQPAWAKSGVGTMADQFFFGSGNDPDRLLRRGRMMVAVVGALLGVLVFLWSRALFGELGAWVVCWCTSSAQRCWPTVLSPHPSAIMHPKPRANDCCRRKASRASPRTSCARLPQN